MLQRILPVTTSSIHYNQQSNGIAHKLSQLGEKNIFRVRPAVTAATLLFGDTINRLIVAASYATTATDTWLHIFWAGFTFSAVAPAQRAL